MNRDLLFDDATVLFGSPTFVTDASAIGDGNPATYVELHTPAVGTTDMIRANFAPPSASAQSITLTLVAARTTATTARLVWDIFDDVSIEVGSQHHLDDYPVDTPITYTRTFDDAYFAPGGQGETEDFVAPTGLTFPDFIDGLRTGAHYMRFLTNAGAAGDKTTRLYTASLVEMVPGAPPLRRYPPVNNGGSGPTRHWPRTVNRRAGGTY